MRLLVKFELQKMIRKKSMAISMVVLVLMVVLLISTSVASEYSTNGSGEVITGWPAIAINKQHIRPEAGLLTTEKIAAAIARYHQVYGDPDNYADAADGSGRTISNEAFGTYLTPDLAIHSLIRFAFTPRGDPIWYTIIGSLSTEDAAVFYENRMNRVNEYLNADSGYGLYSVADQAYFQRLNQRIETPFQFDYTDGWRALLLTLWIMVLVVTVITAISVSRMFAGEYQTGAVAIILTSRYGRNQAVAAKLLASLLLATGLFLLGTALHLIPYLMVYGLSGWNANLQTDRMIAPYPFTLLETYLWNVLIGYLVCLMVTSITLLFSSRMKTPFPVIICTMLLLFVPSVISIDFGSRFWKHVSELFPMHMMNGYNTFQQYELYHIFGQPVLQPVVMGAVAIIVVVLMLPAAYLSFRRHQVY